MRVTIGEVTEGARAAPVDPLSMLRRHPPGIWVIYFLMRNVDAWPAPWHTAFHHPPPPDPSVPSFLDLVSGPFDSAAGQARITA